MGTARITSSVSTRKLAALLLGALAEQLLACPFNSNDPLLQLRDASDFAIVKINTVGPGSCETVGTGFFFSPAGHILTAGHIVPPECEKNTSILVRWSKTPRSSELLGPYQAEVAARSSLDVLVLQLTSAPDRSRQFLQPSSRALDPTTLKNACTLLSSHYHEQNDTYSTFAEIASVSLEGNSRWALSGEGFNPSRSGSPIIVGNGEVAAIFLGRPIDPENREGVIASRGYVQPLAGIPRHEIDIEGLRATPGLLSKFLTLNSSSTASKAKRVRTSFGFSLTLAGRNIEPPFFFEAKNGALSRAPNSLLEAGLQAFRRGLSIVTQVAVERTFKADPGFGFDPTTIEYRVASLNPQNATLPRQMCDEKRLQDCVALSPDRTSMQLRFFLYPGVDERRSWVDAEVHVTQVAR